MKRKLFKDLIRYKMDTNTVNIKTINADCPNMLTETSYSTRKNEVVK